MRQIKLDVLENSRFESRHRYVFDLLYKTGNYNIVYINSPFDRISNIRSCLREDADIVWTGRPWEKALLGWKVPYVLTLRGLFWVEENHSKAFELDVGKKVVRNADVVVILSKYGKEMLVDFDPLVEKKVVVIPNGVEVEKKTKSLEDIISINKRLEAVSNKTIVVVTATNFLFKSKARAVKELIQYYAKAFLKEDFLFVIAGNGPYFTLSDVPKEYRHKIIYTGYYQNILQLLSRADIFVYHTYQDMQPTVVLEAGYCGVPVVSIDCCGMSEWIMQGHTGYICKNLSEMMSKINELRRDDIKRKKMGETAKKFIKEIFTWEDVAHKYDDIFKGMMKNEDVRSRI